MLSIRPEYAARIFSGEKRFEFRRTTFKRPVDTVAVYVTAPVMRVVGEFDVEDILHMSVRRLWDHTRDHAGIDRRSFMDYFEGRSKGYALSIGQVRRYKKALFLDEHFGVKPPQSFIYLTQPWPLT